MSHNGPLAFRDEARRQGIVSETIGRHLLEDQRITKVAQEPCQTIRMKTSLAGQLIHMALLVPEKTRDICLAGNQQCRLIMVLVIDPCYLVLLREGRNTYAIGNVV